MLKSLIRRFIPESVISVYHYLLARVAAVVYGNPSQQLIVIGVTGTNGKSSTVQFIGRLLESLGERIGWTTTIGFKIAQSEWTNDQKMTMLGRFQTQRFLRKMVTAGCRYAIVETSSQGITQSRHVGIAYDVGVFTNLTPEHIEAHGGFEAYKEAKGKLFATLARLPVKVLDGKEIKKVTVVNARDAFAEYFLSFGAGESWRFGWRQKREAEEVWEAGEVWATDVVFSAQGTTFQIEGIAFTFKPMGRFNFENVLAAIATSCALGFSLEQMRDSVASLSGVPGRLERIHEGQPFEVIVDYAPEPAALAATYEAISLLPYTRLIHVLGSTGGGRDVSRRAVLGEMAAKKSDIMIVTNEDPYDDDPMEIINQIADAAVACGKKDHENLFRIVDRMEAIQKAMRVAESGDLILITGKGCEPVMAVAHGKKIPWDDRQAVRQILQTYETAIRTQTS